MVKLQDFARECGITDRQVQRILKKYDAELVGLYERRGPNGTWLSDEACQVLRSKMKQQPIVLGDNEAYRRNEELETKVEKLNEKLDTVRDAYEALLVENADLKGIQARLDASTLKVQLLEANIEKKDQELAEARNEAMEAIVAADNAEKARADADNRAVTYRKNEIEAITRAERAEIEAAELRRQIDALKGRGLWARLFRKGE